MKTFIIKDDVFMMCSSAGFESLHV